MPQLSVDKQITFIYVTDLEASRQFYENLLGFQLWKDQKTCRIYELTSGAYLGICQSSETSKGKVEGSVQNNVIITLVTDDVDDWFNHLQGQGVPSDKPPETNTQYNIYHCFLRDPDGYLIEIQRFLD